MVGLVALGVSASTLLLAVLLLAGPLMMIFMMGGMRGGHGTADQDREPGGGTPGNRTSNRHDHERTASRR